MTQDDLFEQTIARRFEAWRQTRGGAHLLRHCYRIASGYVPRFKRTGRGVSQRLVWELLRYRLEWIKPGLQKRGIEVTRENGFLLNDHFTAHAARHIVAHRPEWNGLFQLREIGKVRKKRKVIIVEERIAA